MKLLCNKPMFIYIYW